MRSITKLIPRRPMLVSLSVVLLAALLGQPAAQAHTRAPELSMIWASHLKLPGSRNDLAEALGVSPDGASVFVTGVASREYGTVAYDTTTGTQRWVMFYSGPFGSGYSVASALAVSPDGTKVFVTGHIQTSDTDTEYATIAYDAATGAELWVARYAGTGGGVNGGTAIAASPDDTTVYVTGYSGGEHVTNYATLAYDAGTGDQRWVTRGQARGLNTPTAMAVSPDGSQVVVTGWGSGYETVSYQAATGTQQWVASDWHGSYPYALAMTPDGAKVLVTGVGKGGDVTTFAYDASTGRRQWNALYDGGVYQEDQGNDLKVSQDGSTVFVTGASLNGPAGEGGDWDYITLAYTVADGHQLWARRYDSCGGCNDYGEAVDVTPDGRTVFVTGRGHVGGINGDAYVTFAYDASTGRPLARAAIGPGDPTSLSVSPDGTAFYVTGWFGLVDPLYYGTVAYSTTP